MNPYHRTQSYSRPCPDRPQRHRTRSGLSVVAAMAAAALAIALAVTAAPAMYGMVAAAFAPSADNAAQEGTAADGSTPVSLWQKGSVPLLLQTDPSWAGEPYAGGTVGENGCGPTCLDMAYICQTGRTDLDPAAMCAFSEQNGFVEEGMTSWRLMGEGARLLGLSSEELPADAGAVKAALADGKTVIASVGPGDFTTIGHFIVISGFDGNGRFSIADPNSERRSGLLWDEERILAQCLNLWAIGA